MHHKHYLLNIRLPVVDENKVQINTEIGALSDINIVVSRAGEKELFFQKDDTTKGIRMLKNRCLSNYCVML